MKIVAVASGKGGVGKTTLTANLGVALAQAGQRVVLFDADLGLANLDIVLGVKSEVSIHHVIEGVLRMTEAVVAGPAGVRVLTGGSGVATMLRLSRKRLEALLLQVEEFESSTDIFLFDTSSGADARVMTFLKAADQVVLVTTQDPASVVDCYSTAKVLFRCKKDALASIVVNMAVDPFQARRAFGTIQSSAAKFLNQPVGYLGCVRKDQRAADMARSRAPFVLAASHLPASQDVRTIANVLITALSSEQDPEQTVESPIDEARAA